MQILIDDLPCKLDANTVGEAIDGASSLARDRGRLIVDVTVDGAKWTQADLASTQRHDQTAEVVRFSSAEPSDLVRHTFADAIDALAEADDLQRQAAELLQSDKGTVAMDKLGEAIAIWLSVQEAIVNGTQLVGLDLATVTVGGKPLPEAIGRLSNRLNAIRSGLRDRNEIELADTLLYDFPPIVEEWRCLLVELQGRIASHGASGE
jgi:hypothetical protein